jgi:hypothetical protein
MLLKTCFAMAFSCLTSLMTSPGCLAVIQAPGEFAEAMGTETGPGDFYCDESGTWWPLGKGQWEQITPALTSLAMV